MKHKKKGVFLINYLIKEPLKLKHFRLLAKCVTKIDGFFRLPKIYQYGKFKKLPSYPGYYSDALAIWKGSGLIKTIDGFLTVTKKGVKYKNNPYSREIPPGDHSAASWKREVKRRKKEREIYQQEKTLAQKLFEGRTIKEARYMTAAEACRWGWERRPIILGLDNGDYIIPSIDEEGNEGGAIYTQTEIIGRFSLRDRV